MKFLNIIFLLAILITLAVSLIVESTDLDKPISYNDDEDLSMSDIAKQTSIRGVSRFLVQRTRVSFGTCNRYPRICRVRGSPGPDCCKRRCVNVANDRLNCGKCGHKCKYSETCCKGKCINTFTNKKHCGGCNNKCKKGSKCVFGMCSYA